MKIGPSSGIFINVQMEYLLLQIPCNFFPRLLSTLVIETGDRITEMSSNHCLRVDAYLA